MSTNVYPMTMSVDYGVPPAANYYGYRITTSSESYELSPFQDVNSLANYERRVEEILGKVHDYRIAALAALSFRGNSDTDREAGDKLLQELLDEKVGADEAAEFTELLQSAFEHWEQVSYDVRRREISERSVMEKRVVVCGNPVDGFRFIGPFDDSAQIDEYAETKLRNEEWWTAPLEQPQLAEEGEE